MIEGDSLQTLATGAVLAAATVGNLTEVTATAPVPPAADGERARFTSGALAGRSFIVGNVSGATFTLMTSGPLPAPGDALVFETTTASIAVAAGLMLTGGPRLLRNLRLILPPTTGPLPALLLIDATLLVTGVRFVTATPAGSFVVLARALLAAGEGIGGIPGTAPATDTPGFAITGFGGPNIGILCQLGASLPLQNCFFRDALLIATTSGVVGLTQSLALRCVLGSNDGAVWTSEQTRFLDGLGDGLNLAGSAGRLSGVDISNSGGSGVRLSGTDLRLDSVTSLVPNADAGARFDAGGRVVASGAGFSVTVTGAANPDVVVGVNPAATWADLAGGIAPRTDFASPFTQVASVACT